ncbi:MAG: hypothetical protein CM15mP23_00540 [Cryomorphaceae bacterium]|nr:MAG: hypothetical protein CM15mP23_00540 [Cryomorphaceae bacterium]
MMRINTDDGSCVYPLFGCTNSTANNYNPNATDDDGTCIILGCTLVSSKL